MSLKDIKGNEKVITRMIQAVKSQSISHAYILEGDARINKIRLANDFVKAILCEEKDGDCCDICLSCNKINHGNHEDIIYLSSEGRSIRDDAVEELQGRIKKKPYVGDRNIVIIQDADTMTLRAQNRLLKTLEEPFSGTVIILLSENIENLTQTIISRCVIYKLSLDYAHEFHEFFEKAVIIADMLLEKKAFYAVSGKLTEFTATKEQALELLDILESWFRDLVICEYDSSLVYHKDHIDELISKSRRYSRKYTSQAIESIEEARKSITKNLNISYTLKNMILNIIA
jgi:DNA polymerase III, gamma/tau subunits